MSPSKEEVLAALRRIVDPARGEDIVTAGMVGDVQIADGSVRVVMEVPPQRAEALRPLATAAEAAVRALPGVGAASVLLTAHYASGEAPRSGSPLAGAGLAPAGPSPARAGAAPANAGAAPNLRGPASGGDGAPELKPLRQPAQKDGPIEGVDRIVAIGSGKGGVGKSTVASNLAVALAAEGRRVGLLDADVYGPSQPRMLGITGRPSSPDNTTILPLRNHGVTLMSIGLLTPEDKATIWRGPMLMGALQQMLRQVRWGKLDVLLVDLPPGTGDVQLTLSQKTELTGAIVVSTPQDVALLDARKALDMFQKTGARVLGMIENMSTFICPKCGEETQIFGHGGARSEAEKLDIPFLGAIPLDIDVRLAGDGGAPIVAAKPDSPQAQRFREIARDLIAKGLA